jgi:hypothetical protein
MVGVTGCNRRSNEGAEMNKDKYPPLPHPDHLWSDSYTDNQMRAYADAATAMQSERQTQEAGAYESAVKGRQEFRLALIEARGQLGGLRDRHAQELAAYELTVRKLRAQLAERGDPPVAWRLGSPEEGYDYGEGYRPRKAEPLYAAPQPATLVVPALELTDEDLTVSNLREQLAAHVPEADFGNIAADGHVLVPVAAMARWRDAFAEELAAYDIDPPIYHVKASHDEICAMLAAAPQPERKPQYLLDGMRFKIGTFSSEKYGSINNIPEELSGRWVAFVAAENDCHMKPTVQPELTDAEICGIAKSTQTGAAR